MNNKSIALNILQFNKQKMSHLYNSKFNKTKEKQIVLIMINNDEKQHCLIVKNLSALLKTTCACSENYCINCLKTI